MDPEKSTRRSSILKPFKPRLPLSSLDFTSTDNPDSTMARVSRRVSFASSNSVKPFVADPEKNTIWDNTYEEEVNHTDSTQSASENTPDSKISTLLNTSSVYLSSGVKVAGSKKMCFSEMTYNEVDNIAVKSGHIKEHGFEVGGGNHNISIYVDSDMELTKCLKSEKENVNLSLNYNSVCGPRTSIDRSNSKINTEPSTNYVSDDMEFTCFSNTDLNTYSPEENTAHTLYFETLNADMEFTNIVSTEVFEKANAYVETIKENCQSDKLEADMDFTRPLQVNIMTLKRGISCEEILRESKNCTITVDKSNAVENMCKEMVHTGTTEKLRKHSETVYFEDMELTKALPDMELINNMHHLIDAKHENVGNNVMLPPNDLQCRSVHTEPNTKVCIENSEHTKDLKIIVESGNPDADIETTQQNVSNTNTSMEGNKEVNVDLEADESVPDMEFTRPLQTNIINLFTNAGQIDSDLNASSNFAELIENKENVPVNKLSLFRAGENTSLKLICGIKNKFKGIDSKKFVDIEFPTLLESHDVENIEYNQSAKVHNKAKEDSYNFSESESTMDVTLPLQSNMIICQRNMEIESGAPQYCGNSENVSINLTIYHDENKENNMSPNEMKLKDTFESALHKGEHKTSYINSHVRNVRCEEPSNQNVIDKENISLADNKMETFENAQVTDIIENKEITGPERIHCFGKSKNKIKDEIKFNPYFRTSREHEGCKSSSLETQKMFKMNEVSEITHKFEDSVKLQGDLTCSSEKLQEPEFNIEKTGNVNSTFCGSGKKKSSFDGKSLKRKCFADNKIMDISKLPSLPSTLGVKETEAKFAKHGKNYGPKETKADSCIFDNSEGMAKPLSAPIFVNTDNIKPEHISNTEFSLHKELSSLHNRKPVVSELPVKKVIDDHKDKLVLDISPLHEIDVKPDYCKNMLIKENFANKEKKVIHENVPDCQDVKNFSVGVPIASLVCSADNGTNEAKNNARIRSAETSNTATKVLYSEPVLILKSRKQPTEILENTHIPNFDSSLHTNINISDVKTPLTSFNFSGSSPCNDDTQQLIQAAQLHSSNTCAQKTNQNYKYEAISNKCNRSFLSAFKEKTFTVENPKVSPRNKNICHEKISKTFNVDSKQQEIVNEKNVDGRNESLHLIDRSQNSDLKEIENCLLDDITPTVLIDEDDVKNSSDNNLGNSTLKARSILNNIQEKLLKYEPPDDDNTEYENVLSRAKSLLNDTSILVNTLKSMKITRINLEEKYEADMLLINSISDTSCFEEHMDVAVFNSLSQSDHIDIPVLLHDRITEAKNRCENYWALVSVVHSDRCIYHFSTLFKTILFKTEINQENGIVYDLEASLQLDDKAEPINHFCAEYFIQRLIHDNLKSVLGINYDILRLLDYVYLTMDQILSFHLEFNRLQDEYVPLQMTTDFRITYEILSVKHIVHWMIIINLSSINSVSQSDISAITKIGKKVNEQHIKALADNISRGPHWLRSFLRNVKDYYSGTVERTGRPKK